MGGHWKGEMTKGELISLVVVDRYGCWIWQNAKTTSGYGHYYRDYKHYYAHRTAYEIYHGIIPKGFHVCHRCDNPPCCNPDHLFLGTDADNIKDCVSKGRHGKEGGKRKLTREEVVKIRLSKKPRQVLADEYEVCLSTIRRIINNQVYKMKKLKRR